MTGEVKACNDKLGELITLIQTQNAEIHSNKRKGEIRDTDQDKPKKTRDLKLSITEALSFDGKRVDDLESWIFHMENYMENYVEARD